MNLVDMDLIRTALNSVDWEQRLIEGAAMGGSLRNTRHAVVKTIKAKLASELWQIDMRHLSPYAEPVSASIFKLTSDFMCEDVLIDRKLKEKIMRALAHAIDVDEPAITTAPVNSRVFVDRFLTYLAFENQDMLSPQEGAVDGTARWDARPGKDYGVELASEINAIDFNGIAVRAMRQGVSRNSDPERSAVWIACTIRDKLDQAMRKFGIVRPAETTEAKLAEMPRQTHLALLDDLRAKLKDAQEIIGELAGHDVEVSVDVMTLESLHLDQQVFNVTAKQVLR